jgi:hypothetical protein
VLAAEQENSAGKKLRNPNCVAQGPAWYAPAVLRLARQSNLKYILSIKTAFA